MAVDDVGGFVALEGRLKERLVHVLSCEKVLDEVHSLGELRPVTGTGHGDVFVRKRQTHLSLGDGHTRGFTVGHGHIYHGVELSLLVHSYLNIALEHMLSSLTIGLGKLGIMVVLKSLLQVRLPLQGLIELRHLLFAWLIHSPDHVGEFRQVRGDLSENFVISAGDGHFGGLGDAVDGLAGAGKEILLSPDSGPGFGRSVGGPGAPVGPSARNLLVNNVGKVAIHLGDFQIPLLGIGHFGDLADFGLNATLALEVLDASVVVTVDCGAVFVKVLAVAILEVSTEGVLATALFPFGSFPSLKVTALHLLVAPLVLGGHREMLVVEGDVTRLTLGILPSAVFLFVPLHPTRVGHPVELFVVIIREGVVLALLVAKARYLAIFAANGAGLLGFSYSQRTP